MRPWTSAMPSSPGSNTVWRDAEVALHNGDAGPRFQTWSDREPVTLFGAWLNANDPADARQVFLRLADAFSEAAFVRSSWPLLT